MARTRKVSVRLLSDKEEKEWIAVAEDGSRLEERHPNPGTAVSNLSRELERAYGDEVEIEYELKLSNTLQQKLDELRALERELKALSERVKEVRYEFAAACLDRRIKQHDIADLMQLSQSYVNTVIKTKGQVTRTGTGERILSRRRRTDL
jgi:hypothetical protein